jgi:hypothetical protein
VNKAKIERNMLEKSVSELISETNVIKNKIMLAQNNKRQTIFDATY